MVIALGRCTSLILIDLASLHGPDAGSATIIGWSDR